jgi:hypothetical protein
VLVAKNPDCWRKLIRESLRHQHFVYQSLN